MKTYIYRGTRDSNSKNADLTYRNDEGEPQGTIRYEGGEPTIAVGDEIKLPKAEAERLAPWFVLEDVDQDVDDIGAGLTAPTTQGLDPLTVDPQSDAAETKTDDGGKDDKSTSPSASTISPKAKTSGNSSK